MSCVWESIISMTNERHLRTKGNNVKQGNSNDFFYSILSPFACNIVWVGCPSLFEFFPSSSILCFKSHGFSMWQSPKLVFWKDKEPYLLYDGVEPIENSHSKFRQADKKCVFVLFISFKNFNTQSTNHENFTTWPTIQLGYFVSI